MRPIRNVRPGCIYEITTRTIDRTKLMRPSKEVNSIIVGVIGRAQEQTGVKIYALVFMSTHYHMLVGCTDADQKAKFIGMVNSNITTKLNALNDRTGSGWSRRFFAIPVSKDRTTQERRLRYLLAHGVKERLVARAKDWPGASTLPWLLSGTAIRGVWTSFTARYHAQRRKGYVPKRGEFDTVYELKMSVLPCWRQLDAPEWRARVADMVAALEADEARRCAEEHGLALEDRVLGAAAVLAAHPFDRLDRQRRSRAPSVHAACKLMRTLMEDELKALREAYAEASHRFRAGEWDVDFPLGTFRPGGGFVAG